MTKKAKGQGSMGSMVTYQELKKNTEDGTQSRRFGVDSQLPFGYCALTVSPVVEPVVTPSGHIYSREAIFEYLLTKNQELKRQQLLYEAQEAAAAAERAAEAEAAEGAAVNQFMSSQLLLTSASTPAAEAGAAVPKPASSSTSSQSMSSALTVVPGADGAAEGGDDLQGRKRKAAAAEDDDDDEDAALPPKQAAVVAKLHQEVGDRVTKQQLKSTSYWLPEYQPEHVRAKIAKPPARPPSPNTGEGLRLKDLFPVNLQVDPDCAGTHEKKYMCAISGKQIVYQEAVLLKKANAVVLEKVFRELAGKKNVCPLTGSTLRPKDVVKLVKPGSSFASGGQVQAKVYKHTIT